MTEDMPHPRPPHLHRELARNGETIWYVRVGHGPRVRIRGAFGSQEFLSAYKAAATGEASHTKKGPPSASLSWLIARYREFGSLGSSLRRDTAAAR